MHPLQMYVTFLRCMELYYRIQAEHIERIIDQYPDLHPREPLPGSIEVDSDDKLPGESMGGDNVVEFKGRKH